MNRAQDHWYEIARLWSEISPPLRPSREELDIHEDLIRGYAVECGCALRGIVLGSTQEFYRLAWPAASQVFALDMNEAMLVALWPGPPGSQIKGNWLSAPLQPNSFDVAMTDGGISTLEYPGEVGRFAASIGDVLKDGGLAILRLYVLPRDPLSPEEVWDELLDGRIRDLSHLKLRLWTALHRREDEGVCVADVWDALNEAFPDLDDLALRIGWEPSHLAAINTYKGAQNRYYFPSIDRVVDAMSAAFTLDSVHRADEPWADTCPILVFKRLPRA
ncbi:MAG: hypothetical protein HZC36_12670 [Armatimonadetes bacterium]|nr:hypothetical protein [Armatimonadota bacterium]